MIPDPEYSDTLKATGTHGLAGEDDDNSPDINLEDNPLFIENDNICANDDFDDFEAMQELDTIPPAFAEAPEIGNAYIHAFIMSMFDHAPDATIHKFLVGQHALFESIYTKHGIEFIGLYEMALNLPAIKQCLGISTKPFIVYYLMCNK
ncbi:hypothetical protein BS47DRAFT_1397878 [Hydnum rufescens UP504]|uniref:Uncharacterized protein n=1 Tax=Hydnum rufescens UP504 TaxID=1448309 RepID=A0A9P6AM96_9AGAM|nr:hypothetical protein BS47DRAFT_1397878 [Hydnum rufescens UP504]